MPLSIFFSQLDPNALTVSIGFFSIWAGIHFALFEAVGNLREIRNRVVMQLANERAKSKLEFVRFLEMLQGESKVLLLEPKKSSPLISRLLWLFLVISALTIAFKPLSTLFPFLPGSDVFYGAYILVLGITAYCLYFEVQYFREFRRLEKKFPADPGAEAKTLFVLNSKKPKHSVQGTLFNNDEQRP